MGHKWIITHVADYLVRNAGRTVPVGELQKETGFTTQQIASAVQNWRDKPGVRDRLVIDIPGRAWRWTDTPPAPRDTTHRNGAANTEHPRPPTVTVPDKPPPAPTGPAAPLMFEHIGQSVTGTLILRDDNGKLYTATEL